MSSHVLAEVSRLAQRIGIIHQGSLLQELDIDELERNRRHRLLIVPATCQPPAFCAEQCRFHSGLLLEWRH